MSSAQQLSVVGSGKPPSGAKSVKPAAWWSKHRFGQLFGPLFDGPAGPCPGVVKVRTRTTADAVVGGVIGTLDAPEALLLGLPDDTGRLRVAGRTSPLTLPARRELGAVLVPPQRTHPWPERIPASRFGQLPGDLVDYTPTEPLLVVEVDTDVCFDHHRWRHPTAFNRVRAELDPMDLSPPGSDDR